MVSSDDFSVVVERLFPGARFRGARRLAGGVSADVHAVALERTDGFRQAVVVRRHPAVDWKPRHRHVARMEYELLRALHLAGMPVPEPLLLDTEGELLPQPFLVTEFVEGTTEIAVDRWDSAVDVMASTLARVHSIPLQGLPDLASRTDPPPELFDYLPETDDNFALREYLSRSSDSAYRGEAVLLHGDYWPGNLLWRDGRLAAILDWEDAALGDPLSDVASCRLELLWMYGAAAVERFTYGYASGRPVDTRRLALWQVYVASAAAHFMGAWGLDPDREADMRTKAGAFVQEAARVLLLPQPLAG